MRRTWLIGGVLVLVGAAVWFWRFDLARDHAQARLEDDGAPPLAIAWSVLAGFADRPELEHFVREQLDGLSRAALAAELQWGFDAVPLLELARQVYDRQPDRLDAAVVASALTLECLNGCSSRGGYADPPGFTTWTWTPDAQAGDAFEEGMRSAAIDFAQYVPRVGTFPPVESYAALVNAVAGRAGTRRDPELAAAVAAFVIAANPTNEMGWLTGAVERFAEEGTAGAVWADALATGPDVSLSTEVWDRVVDAMRRSPVPSRAAVATVVSQCTRRSRPPAALDEACVDLGLAWGDEWASRLQSAATAGTTDREAARALLAAHERERVRTWQDVINDWRAMAPPPGADVVYEVRGRRTSAMNESVYQPVFQRRDARDLERVLAAGAAAIPAVAAQYRAARHPDVVTAAAFVLAKGAPQALSSVVMDRIDAFRPLALSFTQSPVFDTAAYAVEGRRIAVGLLALGEHGTKPVRIHPLILALSIPERGFSEYASNTLRKTLSAREFADALFGFLAVRKSYLVIEVDAYRDALLSYEGVSPAIEANLAGMLAAARGRPERVPWILKVIAISALGAVGGTSARPVLEQYADDGGSYLEFSAPSDEPLEDEPPAEAVERPFETLALCALRAIDARLGISDPSSRPACAGRYENGLAAGTRQ